MTRKKFARMVMAAGLDRNSANRLATTSTAAACRTLSLIACCAAR